MEKRIQKNMLRLIAGTLAAILVLGVGMFSAAMQSILLENMRRNNQSFADQVATSFEIVVDQITDQSYKLIVSNTELMDTLNQAGKTVSATKKLYDILNGIILSNRYIFSVYLYQPNLLGRGYGKVYATEWGCSFWEDYFYDQEILPYLKKEVVATTQPRVVKTMPSSESSREQLVFSLLIPFPLQGSRCVLSINVDARKLYSDILKKNNPGEQMALYLTSEEEKVIISSNISDFGRGLNELTGDKEEFQGRRLPWSLVFDGSISLRSVSVSKALGWRFHLFNEVQLDRSQLFGQYLWVAGILLAAVVLLAISYLVVRRTTKPLGDVMFAYNEKILREILLSGEQEAEKLLHQLSRINRGFQFPCFSMAVFEAVDANQNLSEMIAGWNGEYRQEKLGDIRAVDIRPGVTAILFNHWPELQQTQKQRDYLEWLWRRLSQVFPGCVYAAISRTIDGPERISILYQECSQMLEYKLLTPDHIRVWSSFEHVTRGGGQSPSYPAETEKQLINNMILGNTEGCGIYLERFLDEILSPERCFSDIQIQNCLYQLQNAVLKKLSSLPFSIKVSIEQEHPVFYDAEELRRWMGQFFADVLEEINKKNSRDENVLVDSIFRYIDENLTQDDFNLNAMSYQFNLNRNYLTRLIKEKTGMTFNDYINRRKIAIAKELLADRSLTVEAVAHKIGYAYAHYFIKIFKAAEGVTPGQYREMLDDNKNA